MGWTESYKGSIIPGAQVHLNRKEIGNWSERLQGGKWESNQEGSASWNRKRLNDNEEESSKSPKVWRGAVKSENSQTEQRESNQKGYENYNDKEQENNNQRKPESWNEEEDKRGQVFKERELVSSNGPRKNGNNQVGQRDYYWKEPGNRQEQDIVNQKRKQIPKSKKKCRDGYPGSDEVNSKGESGRVAICNIWICYLCSMLTETYYRYLIFVPNYWIN